MIPNGATLQAGIGKIPDAVMEALKDHEDLGIHTGPLVAGVIGTRKFAYDVWGDTVNTAARLESSGLPGRVNVSEATCPVRSTASAELMAIMLSLRAMIAGSLVKALDRISISGLSWAQS